MSSSLGALQIADWRRRVFGLYAGVRQLSVRNPAAGHELWRSGRDELFAGHPSSPLLPDDRAAFTGLPIAAYDPDWRFEVEVHRAEEPLRISVETGTDGTVPFDLVGSVRIPYLGSLDVWRLASYAGGLFLPVKDALAGKPGGNLRRRALPARHRQGRRSRPRRRRRHPDPRLQLRLQPLVRLRPDVGVPAPAGREHRCRGGSRRRAVPPDALTGAALRAVRPANQTRVCALRRAALLNHRVGQPCSATLTIVSRCVGRVIAT